METLNDFIWNSQRGDVQSQILLHDKSQSHILEVAMDALMKFDLGEMSHTSYYFGLKSLYHHLFLDFEKVLKGRKYFE